MITDDIGVWNSLGEIEPQRRIWLKIPNTATGEGRTFRASFTCADWNNLLAYILIRPRYTTEATDQIGIPLRINPSVIPVIFELPIPSELLDRAISFRDLEIYRVNLKRPKRIGLTLYPIFKVEIEELWG